MKIILVLAFILFMYLRRPIKLFWKNTRLNYLMGLYNSYKNASTHEAKLDAFELIARNKPLSNDLIGSVYFRSPSYKDFDDEQKIVESFFKLNEAFDRNSFWMRKYLINPKYFIKDIFYIPAVVLGFLINHQFNKIPSLLLSSIGWVATILISAYTTEIRAFIDSIIDSVI
ncbi:hypothetical protein B1B04_07595 [Lysinibacillus sp. KCTC 33748]|uniref:hypothetical protein n=1 Tax=unclassified Lysinibacillus TaxID=2636778 RepID=UPI0009A55F23|nr:MULTISPECIES: hypothetical protein [unclassified Lysinibacillus]OXS75567.1 hypothetical protein B1B04_07595 [Lysinibacillus sp. KCTC 33748]